MNRSSSYDRLVPSRISRESYQLLMTDQKTRQSSEKKQKNYDNLLKSQLNPTTSLISYQNKKTYKPYIHDVPDVQETRRINKIPYKILDAPNLRDDFYFSLIDWNNLVVVGLGEAVYTWNPKTNDTYKLLYLEQPTLVSAVKWCPRYDYLAIGDDSGTVRIFDIVKSKIIKQYDNHTQRVGCLDWNQFQITSGSRDSSILVSDIRCAAGGQIQYQSHKQEVCGLQWSPCDKLLASGGNDNQVMISSMHMPQNPIYTFKQHTAAVKALAWSPHHINQLCTGGGTSDKSMKFWNTSTGELMNSVDTGSQICTMKWSANSNEIVTGHGFSLNQIAIWKMPNCERLSTLSGHSYRVLYMALSPDGENIVTGSGDETLRFWKLFPSRKDNIQISQSQLIQPNLR
ncbi:hypothetical protein pb186bvf_007503 [Paramecium bursaria]